jgi:hypothetical protein
MPGPTASRKRKGGRGPCSYCARDGRGVVHTKGRKRNSDPDNPRRSCRGKGTLAAK